MEDGCYGLRRLDRRFFFSEIPEDEREFYDHFEDTDIVCEVVSYKGESMGLMLWDEAKDLPLHKA